MPCFGDKKADTTCNLECLENKLPVHEFVGPVKIVLVDLPRRAYVNKMLMAGLVGMSNLLIGANVMTAMYITLVINLPLYRSLHIILCTFGYQLCVPMGILMISNLNGPSALMKSKDRKKQHMLIQMIGLACAAAGSVAAFMHDGNFYMNAFDMMLQPHPLTGLVAGGFAALSTLNGPIVFCASDSSKYGRCIKCFHKIFAIPAFITSSVCFCLACFDAPLHVDNKLMKEMLFIPVIFCIFYTVVIVITCFVKWARPIPDFKKPIKA